MQTIAPGRTTCIRCGVLTPEPRTRAHQSSCYFAEERFPTKSAEASGSLGDVYRFVQRTLRKRPTPTMTLLGVCLSYMLCMKPLHWVASDKGKGRSLRL